MKDVIQNKSASLTAALMTYYGSEGTRLSTRVKLLTKWLRSYPEAWVRLALIESLYQGRYKTVSVEQLLELWQRRGQPIYHFNVEFAALVCQNIPRELAHFPDEKRDHGFSRTASAKYRPAIATQNDSTAKAIPAQPELESSGTGTGTDLDAAHTDVIEPVVLEQSAANSLNSVDTHSVLSEQVEASVSTLESFDSSDSSMQDLSTLSESALFQLGNFGIDPIHPFVLETEVNEFCEKLVAMASQQG